MPDHTNTSNTDHAVSDQQLAEYARAVAAYQTHPDIGFACCSAHPAAEAAAVLLAEVRRLRAELAAVRALCDEQEMAARLFELPEPAWVRAVRRAVSAVSGAADSRHA